MKLILIGVILITLFTNTTMAKNKKNINWKQIMTSDEAYTYTPNPVKSFMTEWGKSGKNLGLNDVMMNHKTRTGKTFDDKTVARVLKRLQKRGLVIRSNNVPEMTPVWGGGDNKRQEYRIKARSVLITITEAGKVELRGYDK